MPEREEMVVLPPVLDLHFYPGIALRGAGQDHTVLHVPKGSKKKVQSSVL